MLLRTMYVLAAPDEVADDGDGALRGIGHHRVPAIRKPFEPHQMLRQRRRDIRLALDWVNGIVLATEYQGRTSDAVEIAEHIEGVALAVRSREPLQDLRAVDGTPRHVRISCDARVERDGQPSLGVQRGLIRVTLDL